MITYDSHPVRKKDNTNRQASIEGMERTASGTQGRMGSPSAQGQNGKINVQGSLASSKTQTNS